MSRYTQGAELLPDGRASFRVWAAGHRRVDLVLDGAEMPMAAEADGYFTALVPARPGSRYGFRVDGEASVLGDPASRWQPEGPDALSGIYGSTHAWRHERWPAPTLAGAVLYELHVGTFTQPGTWRAAIERLPHLKALGVTLIEVMPAACFAGRFGWGYDVALPFAPAEQYGTPDDMRAFVDAAHGHGLGVILDVVYNHFGFSAPFERYSDHYFSDEKTDWGRGLRFHGPDSAPVRAFFAENARYWVDEFRVDGLRFDAVQAIKDSSDPHILTEIMDACRATTGRTLLFIGENERQEARLLRPVEQGGIGVDGAWSDDFHHAAVAAVTGRHEAYYSDTPGRPQELAAALKHGYLFQGQRYDWQDKARGTPVLDRDASQFIHFLDNHDQIANSGTALRLHQKTSLERWRAMTALLLLGRQTPMLFQGQEFMASSPFCYFLDQHGDLGDAVRAGRRKELSQFPSLADPALELPDPISPATFARSKLDWSEADGNAATLRLHRDLLALRRDLPALRRPHSARAPSLDASVIGPEALLVRMFGEIAADDLLLLCNLGGDLALPSIPDPLAAPPDGTAWRLLLSTEQQIYGGSGQAVTDLSQRIVLGAARVLLFASVEAG